MRRTQDDVLKQARDAYERREYGAAYRGLTDVRQSRGLATDDLDMLADAAWWLGLTSDTLALGEEVYRRYLDDGHVDRAALNALGLGFVWLIRGDEAIGSGWIHRARRLLEGRPPSQAQGLLTYVDVSIALESQDLDTALAGARELQRQGEDFAAPTLTALGLLSEGTVLIRRGDMAEGFALLDEAMLPVLADLVSPDWAGNIYCSILLVCTELADVPRARQWTEATERWCARFSDAVMFLGICRAHRVQLMNVAGDWSHAQQVADQVRADLADVNAEVVAECDYQLGDLHRLRGELAAARGAYSRARERGRDPQPGEALLLLRASDPEASWAAIAAAIAECPPNPFQRARLLLAQAEIGLAAGHLDAAAHAAEELAGIGQRYPTPGFVAWSDHAAGAVLLEQGHAEDARLRLLASCRAYDKLPDPYQAARVRTLLAKALRLCGDDAGAAGQEALASAALTRLGAAPERVKPVVATKRPGRLTGRELEVLGSIARGASNKVAADELFISEKTVRRHLANIYAKLGVGSRTAAAAWAHDEGLVRPCR